MWNNECEEASRLLKSYLMELAILAKPVSGEPLYLYNVVSAVVVSGVFVRED